ncbi:MAG: PilZ domain-containing protein [Nitrospirae bacterium]|nr:PilZ domain-containing protein [Nitrospirota bacterium]
MSNKNASDQKAGMPANNDKRANARVPVPFIPLTVENGMESLACSILNISMGGALIQAPHEFARNSSITTSFELPGDAVPIVTPSRVVWTRNVYDIHVRIGIRFEASEAVTDRVGGYVDRQMNFRPVFVERAAARMSAPCIAVVINDGRKVQNGVILDISRSGVLLQTAEPINPGSVVTASFILPHTHKVVKTQAKVVWRKNLYGQFENKGLEFVNIDPTAEKYIENFVEKQALCGV